MPPCSRRSAPWPRAVGRACRRRPVEPVTVAAARRNLRARARDLAAPEADIGWAAPAPGGSGRARPWAWARARRPHGGRRTRATRRAPTPGSRSTGRTSPRPARSLAPGPRTRSLPSLLPRGRRAGVPGGRRGSAAHQLGNLEGQVERLACVQPRVAQRLVPVLEVVTEDLLGAAEALGDVLAGELDVDAPGPHVSGGAGGEEAAQLAHDVLEAPCLVTAVVHESVPVHGVARPDDRVTRHAHRPQQRRE